MQSFQEQDGYLCSFAGISAIKKHDVKIDRDVPMAVDCV
jgi:hypothetical protein